MTDDTETDDASNNSNFSALMSDRQALQRVFIVLLALGISIIFIWMIRGFLSPLFMAAVFAMFLNPVHRFLKPITFGSSSAAAGVVLVLAVVGVLIPLTAILAIVADQAVQVTGAVAPWLQEQIRGIREGGMDAFPQWLPFRDSLAPYQQEITNQAGQFASNIGGWVVDGLRKATSGTFGAFLDPTHDGGVDETAGRGHAGRAGQFHVRRAGRAPGPGDDRNRVPSRQARRPENGA